MTLTTAWRLTGCASLAIGRSPACEALVMPSAARVMVMAVGS
jgi:hypothetical protein